MTETLIKETYGTDCGGPYVIRTYRDDAGNLRNIISPGRDPRACMPGSPEVDRLSRSTEVLNDIGLVLNVLAPISVASPQHMTELQGVFDVILATPDYYNKFEEAASGATDSDERGRLAKVAAVAQTAYHTDHARNRAADIPFAQDIANDPSARIATARLTPEAFTAVRRAYAVVSERNEGDAKLLEDLKRTAHATPNRHRIGAMRADILPGMTKARIQIIGAGGQTKSSFEEFLINAVSEQDAERTTVTETFGKPFVFSSGRFMQRYTFHGAVRGYPTNWTSSDVTRELQTSQHYLFQQFYDRHLRSTEMAKTRRYARVIVDEDIYDGYITTLNLNREAATDGFVPFTFTLVGLRRGHMRSESDAAYLLKRFESETPTAGAPSLEELKADAADATGEVELEVSTGGGEWGASGTLSYTFNRGSTDNRAVTFQVRVKEAGKSISAPRLSVVTSEFVSAVPTAGTRVVDHTRPLTYTLQLLKQEGDPSSPQVITITAGSSSVTVNVTLTLSGDRAISITSFGISGAADTPYADVIGTANLTRAGNSYRFSNITLNNPFQSPAFFTAQTTSVRYHITATGYGPSDPIPEGWQRDGDRFTQVASLSAPGAVDYSDPNTPELPTRLSLPVSASFGDATIAGAFIVNFPRPADARWVVRRQSTREDSRLTFVESQQVSRGAFLMTLHPPANQSGPPDLTVLAQFFASSFDVSTSSFYGRNAALAPGGSGPLRPHGRSQVRGSCQAIVLPRQNNHKFDVEVLITFSPGAAPNTVDGTVAFSCDVRYVTTRYTTEQVTLSLIPKSGQTVFAIEGPLLLSGYWNGYRGSL